MTNTKSSFIVIIAFLAVIGATRAAILKTMEAGAQGSARSLAQESKREMYERMIKVANDKTKAYYRDEIKSLIPVCLNPDVVIENAREERPPKAPRGWKPSPLNPEQKKSQGTAALAEVRKHCILAFFFSPQSQTEHPDWSTCMVTPFWSFMQKYELFAPECMQMVEHLKNYNKNLGANKVTDSMFFSSYKSYYFKYADVQGENQAATSALGISPLLLQTVVSINEKQGNGDDRFDSHNGSGNLVNFDAATKTFNNICGNGKKKDTVNFLLTALHCLHEYDKLLYPSKLDTKNVPLSIDVTNPVAMISFKHHIDSRESKKPIQGYIMAEKKNSNEVAELKLSTPIISAGVKIIGQHVFAGLFQDTDTVVVKLDRPIEITCQDNEVLDFSNANEDKQARSDMLQVVTNNDSLMNLYGFPGGQGPYRIRMHPLTREVTFPEDRPPQSREATLESIRIKTESFAMNGAAINGASGGPLFYENGPVKKFIATIIRGSDHASTALEAQFNARKVPKD